MSDVESSNPSDLEELIRYECRKCPGQLFTAAERDIHRRMHRNVKTAKPKPNTRQRGRASSPNVSQLTLFNPVDDIQQNSSEEEAEEVVNTSPGSMKKVKGTKRRAAAAAATAATKSSTKKPDKIEKVRRQRKSIKRYHAEDMPSTRYNSG